MARRLPPFIHDVAQARPGKQIEIWFQDEARFGQKGILTTVWAECGSRPRAVRQTEYEWVYVYGAVNPLTGASVGMLAPTVNTDWMAQHLRLISEHVGNDVHVVLVMDQAGWHTARKLELPQNITILLLPPCSPELNPVERLWHWLKSHYLSNRVYEDYEQLLDVGCDAWNRLSPDRISSVCRTEWIEHVI